MKAIIAAVDQNWGIGKDGKIPWYFKEDFSWFKEQTKDSVCIMGKNTFLEIAEKFKFLKTGKCLPGRICIVVSNELYADSQYKDNENVKFRSDLNEAYNEWYLNYKNKNLFFIGGAKIFEEALNMADTMFLTKIKDNFNCDSFFPHEKFSTKEVISYDASFSENGILEFGVIKFK